MSVKSFNTLRKLAKARLDRDAALLIPLQERLGEIRTYKEQVLESIATASRDALPEDPGLSIWIYQQFLTAAKNEIASLDARIAQLKEEITEQEKKVRTHFAEMRGYEIIIEKRNEEALKKQRRQESIELDDISQRKVGRLNVAHKTKHVPITG